MFHLKNIGNGESNDCFQNGQQKIRLSFFLGRILFGFGVSFVMHGVPAYLAEMCPADIRGVVVSVKETVIVGGIVLGYAVGNWMSSDPLRWADLYKVCALLPLPMLLLLFYIPRSKHGLRTTDETTYLHTIHSTESYARKQQPEAATHFF